MKNKKNSISEFCLEIIPILILMNISERLTVKRQQRKQKNMIMKLHKF